MKVAVPWAAVVRSDGKPAIRPASGHIGFCPLFLDRDSAATAFPREEIVEVTVPVEWGMAAATVEA